MNKKIFIISIIIIFLLQLNSFGKYIYTKKICAYELIFKPLSTNENNYNSNIIKEENSENTNNLKNIIQIENNNIKQDSIIIQIIK